MRWVLWLCIQNGTFPGSHIGVVVRVWVLPCMRSGFLSTLGTRIHYIQNKLKNRHIYIVWLVHCIHCMAVKQVILCIPDIKLFYFYCFIFFTWNISLSYGTVSLSFLLYCFVLLAYLKLIIITVYLHLFLFT